MKTFTESGWLAELQSEPMKVQIGAYASFGAAALLSKAGLIAPGFAAAILQELRPGLDALTAIMLVASILLAATR